MPANSGVALAPGGLTELDGRRALDMPWQDVPDDGWLRSPNVTAVRSARGES
jgi:hypothetical protein